jgi:hypothetical protein
MMASVTEDALTVGYVLDYLASRTRPTAPASAVQGVIYDAKSTLDKDGTHHGGIGYEYSKPVETAAQTISSTMVAAYEIAYLNARTKPVIPSATPGWTYDAKSTLAKDGTFNGGIGYEYAAPTELYLTWVSNDGTKGFRKYHNQQTVPSTIAALGYDTDNTVFGSYDPKNGTMDFMVHVTTPQGGLSMQQAQIDVSEHTSVVRQVIGYSESKGKWLIQKWTRYERYYKSRSSAVAYIGDTGAGNTDKENGSITYASISGGYWLAIYWKREGAVQEKDQPNEAIT